MNYIKTILEVILLVLSLLCLYTLLVLMIQKLVYHINIKCLEKVSPQKLRQIVEKNNEQNRNTVVYFGRPTCPYCRQLINKMIKDIKKASLSHNIYYIETKITTNDFELEKIRSKYNIDFVPEIIKVSSGEVKKYQPGQVLSEFI